MAVPLGRITYLLGYSDLSSFARAFRRWTGRAPSEWRAELSQRPGITSSAEVGGRALGPIAIPPMWMTRAPTRAIGTLIRKASLRPSGHG